MNLFEQEIGSIADDMTDVHLQTGAAVSCCCCLLGHLVGFDKKAAAVATDGVDDFDVGEFVFGLDGVNADVELGATLA